MGSTKIENESNTLSGHGAEWLLFVGHILPFRHKLILSNLNSHVGS